MSKENVYYLLREGSTQEEQWSWQEIEAQCRAGELTPGARIFLPGERRWEILGETPLADSIRGKDPERDVLSTEEREQVGHAYKDAREHAAQNPGVIEAQLDAAILAAEVDDRKAAREHFQAVLNQHPYHARAAQEIKRRFSAAECRAFHYLDRPQPAWEDLYAVVSMPFGRGPWYLVVSAAAFALLSLVPLGAALVAVLGFLWGFQVMEYAARGNTRPPHWNASFQDPLRKILRPVALMGGVIAQWLIVFGAAAKLAVLVEGRRGVPIVDFIAGSPVFLVIAAIVAFLYFPAAMVSIGGFVGPVSKTLDPRRLVRIIVHMEHEYVYSVGLLFVLGIAVAIVRVVAGGIPVLGSAITGFALAVAIPMGGLVLGRLLGRMGHVIA